MKTVKLELKSVIGHEETLVVQHVGVGLCLYLPARLVRAYDIEKGDQISANLLALWKVKGVSTQ